MDTRCPECGRPAEITWSGQIRSEDEPRIRLAVRCVDLHWSVVEDSEPHELPWGTVRHRSRSAVRPPRSA